MAEKLTARRECTLRNVRKVLVERRLTDIAGRLHALREN